VIVLVAAAALSIKLKLLAVQKIVVLHWVTTKKVEE